MDDKIKGAWLVHHTAKLQKIREPLFENISFAGKCGHYYTYASLMEKMVGNYGFGAKI